MLSCLHSSHSSSWTWRSKSLTVRKKASIFVLNQLISLNDKRIAWDTTCKQTHLHLYCQNAVRKERSKLHGKRPERESWLPKRQSTAGKEQKNAAWDYIIPYTSHARASLFHSQQIPHNQQKKFGIFKRANTRIHVVTLGADKQVPELHPLLKRKSIPTAKRPGAVTLAEDVHCKLCTASQNSEMLDRRMQAGSIA